MAYTTIDDPELYFQAKAYTGNGGTQSITLDGDTDLSPNFVWIKNRSGTDVHALYDSVRGANKNLRSDANAVEGNQSDGLTSFDSDGFSVGAAGSVNTNTNNFASWSWKAGTSFTNDASSTGVGTIDSSGSVNDTAGFSICKWVGTGSNGTVKHGLSTIPQVIIQKNTSYAYSWYTWHVGIDMNQYLKLDTTGAAASGDTGGVHFGNTDPTTSVFSLGNDGGTNRSGDTHIAYIFSERQGYSKFGKYTGNGNADGPYIYTGFRPAFIIIKQSSAARDWIMVDNKRNTFNVVNNRLFPNSTDAQNTSVDALDFTSNGFKIRNTNTTVNVSDGTYVYYAFAESPFVNSNGAPNNAR